MPITHDFDYKKPKIIGEVLELLNNKEKKNKILAGGTDLTMQLKEDLIKPDLLIDIKGINELNKIEFRNNELFIGANITFSELIDSQIIKEKIPALWEAANTVASVAVRNRATLVGNICSAVPSLDSAPALLIYKADVIVKNIDADRTIPIEKWFVAPKKTAIRENELVIGIKIKLPKEKSTSCYSKLGRYEGEDLAQAGVGVFVNENKEYKIAFCAVGPVPKRAYSIEKFLKGKKISAHIIEEVKKLIPKEISPITDIRATKKYRTEMIKVMTERALIKLSE